MFVATPWEVFRSYELSHRVAILPMGVSQFRPKIGEDINRQKIIVHKILIKT